MSLTFSCPSCDRSYSVNESLAGKRVRCKDCGEEIRIPTAPTRAGAEDLFGLDEGVAPRASGGRRSAPDEEVGVAPRRLGRAAPRSKRARGRRDDPERASRYRKALMFVVGFGLVAYALPFFGLVLRPRGGRGMDPESQKQIGLAFAVIGGILLGISYGLSGLRAGLASSLGEARADRIATWSRRLAWGIPLGIVLLFFAVQFVRQFLPAPRAPEPPPPAFFPRPHAGVRVGPGRQPLGAGAMTEPGGVPVAGGPRGFRPMSEGGASPNSNPATGGVGDSESSDRIVLSSGSISPAKNSDGTPSKGLTVTAEYEVKVAIPPGPPRFFFAVKDKDRDYHFPAPPTFRGGRGTVRATLQNLSRENGPFVLRLDAGRPGPGGFQGETVSNEIPLEWKE